ncbi:MAG: hypothetical protein ACOYKJ_07475 [Candidatus Howiella sp.]|jgi:peptidoglycan hydrolase CwlO-like protein
MDKLALSDWVAVLSALGMILSLAVTVSTLVSKGQRRSAADAELKSDVKHIKEMVDSTLSEVGTLGGKLDGIDIRLTRAEESCKSAHKRIDTLHHGVRIN